AGAASTTAPDPMVATVELSIGLYATDTETPTWPAAAAPAAKVRMSSRAEAVTNRPWTAPAPGSAPRPTATKAAPTEAASWRTTSVTVTEPPMLAVTPPAAAPELFTTLVAS